METSLRRIETGFGFVRFVPVSDITLATLRLDREKILTKRFKTSSAEAFLTSIHHPVEGAF